MAGVNKTKPKVVMEKQVWEVCVDVKRPKCEKQADGPLLCTDFYEEDCKEIERWVEKKVTPETKPSTLPATKPADSSKEKAGFWKSLNNVFARYPFRR